MTREQVRAIALAHAGLLTDAERARCQVRAPEIPELEGAGAILWRTTIASLEELRCLGLEKEKPLMDAYVEAHVDLVLAIIEGQR